MQSGGVIHPPVGGGHNPVLGGPGGVILGIHDMSQTAFDSLLNVSCCSFIF
jgi:hypothetical protein